MILRLLGEVGLLVDGREVGLGPARQRCVLAALAVDANLAVSVDRLTQRVWGERPPSRSRATLSVYLSRLRQVPAVAPSARISRRSGGYVLEIEPAAVDLERFRDLCRRARAGITDDRHAAGLLTEAVGLCHGEALTGLVGDWVTAERDRLAQELAEAEHDRTDVLLRLGHGPDLLADLARRATANPVDERVARQYLIALSRAGRTADALTHYERISGHLAEELGADPGAALRQAHTEVLRTSTEPPLGPCSLPYRIPDFVGRELELDQLRQVLHGGATVLVHGMAGIGKTAVAVRACHDSAPRFPDGQLYIDLHGYTPGHSPLSPAAALSDLLAQLDIPPTRHPDGLDARAALWRARTAGRKVLVLLDNAAGAHQLRPLLPGTSSAAVVATSRRRLTALEGAHTLALDLLPDADAMTLFTAVSGREGAAAAALCGGLPLALRIAAARLRNRPHWTPDDLARRLAERRQRLSELRTTDQDLAAVFALSYRELDPSQQRMFRLLGAHPGTRITLAAASALADTSAPGTEPLLDALLDAHLLVQLDREAYALHDLLAEHARSLTEPAERSEALDRLLDYFRGGGADQWHAQELPNLRAITQCALERGQFQHGWRIADHTARYLRMRGHRDEFLAVARLGVTAAEHLDDPHALLPSLENLANAHWEAGRLQRAMEVADTQRRLAAASDAPVAHATALSRIGTLHGMFGDYRQALAYYQKALSGSVPDTVTAVVLGNLSHAHEMLGEFDQALAAATRARRLREQAEDWRGWALATAQEALVLARLGRLDEALATAARAVGTAERHDDAFGQAWACTDHAEVLLAADRPEEAYRQARRACTILADLNQPLLLTMAANTLGDAHLALGEPRPALDHYRTAHHTAERIHYQRQKDRAREGYDRARAALALPAVTPDSG
ncbi:AfsR/SARP family transcriptional regulator [Amycolatopsis magusensis]|uniref:DNA-binding SARP family transcriptional activator/tetratricopeptide (TPR) repeat protein n=1 Tax=Amycolatopsis magusensis TaxID=882444 RepID=A0ABS4PUV3_9PSEU|nr:BTAD domain-containing putative transcriptional regulator [Amycolatopsis magusensis]MBP2182690.1 DNA-binding SARP family transcriptional activator/tetratricopeptide (TPR) repeat protein [Amycolatopsis magusensis]